MKRLLPIILIVLCIGATLVAGSILEKRILVTTHIVVLPESQTKPTCCHQSYFSTKDFYEVAYQDAGSLHTGPGQNQLFKQRTGAAGILVNHHLLAAPYIAEAFNGIASDAPVTVVIISPNHFSAGKGSIITSNAIWKTPYGELIPGTKLIQELNVSELATIEETPFDQEHGISGIVGFIKKSLPNATIVPLIVNDHLPIVQAVEAADKISQSLTQNVVFVGSFDFSHYLPSRAADFHDLESESALQNFDYTAMGNLDTDSRPGLALFERLLQDSQAQHFHELEHSNSAKLSGQDILETTSYITGYFSSEPSATRTVATLLSLGTMTATASTSARIRPHTPEYALTYMERLFYGQDATLSFLQSGESEVPSLLSHLGLQTVTQDSYLSHLGSYTAMLVNCARVSNPKQFIDAGADVVICQGALKNSVMLYKNKPIISTNGNYFDPQSMAVGLAVVDGQLQAYLFPIAFSNGQQKLLVGQESDRVLVTMAKQSMVSADTKKQIQSGIISFTNVK